MSRTRNSKGEAGFTLAGLIVISAVIMIFVAATVPRQWSKIMARERDRQTIFIMKQYARAIHAFREKHKTLPVSMQQIIEARQPRLVRGDGKWIDPLTGEVDWIPVPASAQQPQQVPQPGAGGLVPGSGMGQGVLGPGMQPQPLPTQQPTTGQPGGMVGPIIGVRPNKTGPSFLALKGAENYEQWMYTVIDLDNEINNRRNALLTK